MTSDALTTPVPRSFRSLLASAVRNHPDQPALRSASDGGWTTLTWHDVGELVVEAARWLDAKSFVERISVLSPASAAAWILEAGALVAGIDINPIYEDALADERDLAISSTKPDLIAIGSPDLAALTSDYGVPVVDLEVALEEWRIHQAAGPRPFAGELAAWIERWAANDAAVLLQSTGTTGPPTVIELGDSAMTAATWSLRDEIEHSHPRFLAFLPAAHTSHVLINFYAATMFAADVWIGGGVDTITEDLAVCKPTVMFGAPLLFHAIRDEFRTEAGGTAVGRLVYGRLEKRAAEILDEGQITRTSATRLGRFVGRFIARSAGLGDARELFSGTSPLDGETHAFFAALGWYVRNTYGLTECGGAATVSGRDSMVVGELGQLVEGLDMRFADDGEMLLRGPANMRRKLGRTPLEPGDWLSTGDLGVADGKTVRFVGRKAELVHNASGESATLSALDEAASQAVGRGHCVTVRLEDGRLGLVVNAEEDGTSPPPAADVGTALAAAGLSDYITRVAVVDEPLLRQRGELGATGKVRRWKVAARMARRSTTSA